MTSSNTGSYEISFKRSVAKDLRRIPNTDVKRLLSRIQELRDNPRGGDCIKVAGQDRYRVRVGRYRILYEIRDRQVVVIVVKVADRSRAY